MGHLGPLLCLLSHCRSVSSVQIPTVPPALSRSWNTQQLPQSLQAAVGAHFLQRIHQGSTVHDDCRSYPPRLPHQPVRSIHYGVEFRWVGGDSHTHGDCSLAQDRTTTPAPPIFCHWAICVYFQIQLSQTLHRFPELQIIEVLLASAGSSPTAEGGVESAGMVSSTPLATSSGAPSRMPLHTILQLCFLVHWGNSPSATALLPSSSGKRLHLSINEAIHCFMSLFKRWQSCLSQHQGGWRGLDSSGYLPSHL